MKLEFGTTEPPRFVLFNVTFPLLSLIILVPLLSVIGRGVEVVALGSLLTIQTTSPPLGFTPKETT